MTQIVFVGADGVEFRVEATDGKSLMEAAVQNSVPGIDADCGGTCSCATCHVYLTDDWFERLGGATDQEAIMLDFADNIKPTSRLSCQIDISPDLAGLTAHIPESQH